MITRRNCDFCVEKKVKCDGHAARGCSLCARKGKICTFSPKQKPGPKGHQGVVDTTPPNVASPAIPPQLVQRRPSSPLALPLSFSGGNIDLGEGSIESGGSGGGGGGGGGGGAAAGVDAPSAGGVGVGGGGGGGRAAGMPKNKRKTLDKASSSSPPKRAKGKGRPKKTSSSSVAAAGGTRAENNQPIGGGGGSSPGGDRDKTWGPGAGQQLRIPSLPSWINNPYGDPDGLASSMKYCGGGGGGGAARGDRDDAWGPGVGQQRAMLPLPSWINNPYGDPDGPAISMKPGHGGGVGAAASIGNRDEARVRSTARGGTSLFDGWGFGFTQQGGYVDPYDDREEDNQSKSSKKRKLLPAEGTAYTATDRTKRRHVLAAGSGPARPAFSPVPAVATITPATPVVSTSTPSLAQEQQGQQQQQYPLLSPIDSQTSNARESGVFRTFSSVLLDLTFGRDKHNNSGYRDSHGDGETGGEVGSGGAELGIDVFGQMRGAGIASTRDSIDNVGHLAPNGFSSPFVPNPTATSVAATATSALNRSGRSPGGVGPGIASSGGSSNNGAHLATNGVHSPFAPSAAAPSGAAAAAASPALREGVDVRGDVVANPVVMARQDERALIDGDERFGLEGWMPLNSLHTASDKTLAAMLFDDLWVDDLLGMVPQTDGGAAGVGVV